jgi:MYXO-CTERM domain-containing protein
MRATYIEAIQRFAPLRFCFIHNTSGKMAYVHTHHNTIAKTIGGKSYPYGGELELQDGRLRFWSAKTHWTAWQSQFERVFFGTTWGEDPNPPQPPTPTPTPPTPPTPTPPAADRWLGDACAAASKCASQSCLQSAGATSFPGGMCSQPCSQLCPDRAGEPTSFCVSFDAASGKFGGTQGQCFARCDTGAHPGSGCREGYACVKLARNKQSSVKRNVCVPQQPTALGGDGQGSVQLIGEPPDADGDRPNPEQEAAGGGGEELDASGLTGGAGCALAPAAPADDSAPLLLLGLAAIAVLARRRR